MALQKVFREAYVQALKNNIDTAKYSGESFDYEESQVHYMANVHQPENLLERMDENDELKSAIALYEEYKELTPLAASKNDLWALPRPCRFVQLYAEKIPCCDEWNGRC